VLLVVLAVLLVLTAVLWAAGGLRARASGPVAVRPGGVADQGAFAVQVLDARAGHMKTSDFEPVANLLVVRMRVTNRADRSYGIVSFLQGIVAEPRPGRYVKADVMKSEGHIGDEVTSTIHPRLPVTVELVWPMGDATPAPRTVKLALRRWEYGQSFTTDTFYWSVTSVSPIAATVTVPVRAGATS
jgi:hypothetical protein